MQCELLLWAQYTGWKFIVNTGVAYIRASNWASRYFRIMILTIRFQSCCHPTTFSHMPFTSIFWLTYLKIVSNWQRMQN